MSIRIQIPALALSLVLSASAIQALPLTLQQSLQQAQKNDPWLQGSRHQQDALLAQSVAANTLPDPTVTIGLNNIASDSLRFEQEMMSQFKLSVSQTLARGDSLKLRQKQFQQLAQQQPLLRQNRIAMLRLSVSQLWLEIYKAQQSIHLIESDRALFEQLNDVVEASYSSTAGKTSQQDLVRAQLELTRLEDRLSRLKQQHLSLQQQLQQWLSPYGLNTQNSYDNATTNISLTTSLVKLDMRQAKLYLQTQQIEKPRLYALLEQHPAIAAIDKQIDASQSNVQLAKQKYKPEWGLNFSYGYRDDSPLGEHRNDLVSASISFDLPLFTAKRQDQQLQAAVSATAAINTDKDLLLRKFSAQFNAQRERLLVLKQRQQLYKNRLLPQMSDQADASLSAYTNDDGDFSEVVRSRIAQLNASIDALIIDVDIQKTIAQLNYFMPKKVEPNYEK